MVCSEVLWMKVNCKNGTKLREREQCIYESKSNRSQVAVISEHEHEQSNESGKFNGEW